MTDFVDKAVAWDKISEKNEEKAQLVTEIERLRAALKLLHDNLAEYQRINNLPKE